MSEDTPKMTVANIELALTARGLDEFDFDEWFARSPAPNVIVAPPETVSRIEILEPTPTRYPLRAPWHPEEGEQYAAGFWLPYRASAEDARQHVADFYRTRIEPGADPRAQWDVGVYFHDPDADGPVFERRLPDGTRTRLTTSGWLDVVPGVTAPYVPHDVCRWRSTKHRAELTRRAREYAESAQTLVGR